MLSFSLKKTYSEGKISNQPQSINGFGNVCHFSCHFLLSCSFLQRNRPPPLLYDRNYTRLTSQSLTQCAPKYAHIHSNTHTHTHAESGLVKWVKCTFRLKITTPARLNTRDTKQEAMSHKSPMFWQHRRAIVAWKDIEGVIFFSFSIGVNTNNNRVCFNKVEQKQR